MLHHKSERLHAARRREVEAAAEFELDGALELHPAVTMSVQRVRRKLEANQNVPALNARALKIRFSSF